jgi:transposase-like protein/DDE family transposase
MSSLLGDFEAAEFGDRRLTRRLLRIVEALTPDPSASFPQAAGTDASLEATYRFFQNDSVSPQQILAPHVRATVARAQQEGLVIVAHDTTEFSFSTAREGLGRINHAGRGFWGHFALALSADGARRPLGVLGLQTLVRTGPTRPDHHSESIPEEQRESFRWKQLVNNVANLLHERAQPIHVMDSEADAFPLLAYLVAGQHRFVVRLRCDRRITDDAGRQLRLEQKLPSVHGRFVREVTLSTRPALYRVSGGHRRNLPRSPRSATLEFAATQVTLHPPARTEGVEPILVNIVHVREVDAPAGVEPVDWKLVTTQPIGSTSDLEHIVDAYRARWAIEEFFKALKTGCAFEKRQLETLPALLNALAVLTPVACNLLHLRTLARENPDAPASNVLPSLHLRVLERHPHTKLQPAATAYQAMLAVARPGGHISNNGDPGWIVLGRGYDKLLALVEGLSLGLNL